MNLLITTLGTWNLVPELFALTNPQDYDFYGKSPVIKDFREKNKIKSVDEIFVISTENPRDAEKLTAWAEKWNCRLKIFVCKGISDFTTEDDVLKFRSFLYRIVLYGKEKADVLYLSLAGGRKTMSADMQEAGNLFGCDAMLHIIDVKEKPKSFNNDDLLGEPKPEYGECFIPALVTSKIEQNLLVTADARPLRSCDFPLFVDESKIIQNIEEDCSLLKEIQSRKEKSSQIYVNFYTNISKQNSKKRDIFRKLYFLHPASLQKLRDYKFGNDTEKDLRILKKIPKAELHSHLGGVLSPEEIIQVAQEEKNYAADIKNPASVRFKNHIQKILSYKNIEDFEKAVYGEYLEPQKFYRIGIDKYRQLGDFQGSGLLQTEKTISRTIELYAQSLIAQNVKYVEIRCSPYNYTRAGLTINQVVNCMMKTLDLYKNDFEYRFIYILNRSSKSEAIKESVDKILNLLNENKNFAQKLVAIDLAGSENEDTRPSKLREYFMPLLEKCINITIHAGETDTVQSIWEAVYHLSADRIGHGLKLLDNEELINRLLNKNIGIEMCPSSNQQIVGFNQTDQKYPLVDYLNRGLKVTINTDDQGISRTNLTAEFKKALELCPGLTLWDFIVMIRNSLSIAFCDSELKNRLMHDFEDQILNILTEEL